MVDRDTRIEAAARAHYETFLGTVPWDELSNGLKITNVERMKIALAAADAVSDQRSATDESLVPEARTVGQPNLDLASLNVDEIEQALHDGEIDKKDNTILSLVAEVRRLRAAGQRSDPNEYEQVAGEALHRARLALTALALRDDGFSDDKDEPGRILAALCSYLVQRGAVDPDEEPT